MSSPYSSPSLLSGSSWHREDKESS
jgi:hypothetical protein